MIRASLQVADDEDLVLTVTCRDSRAERNDLPVLRWFNAQLSLESLDEPGQVVAHLADALLVLISLADGLDQAFFQADACSGDLAAPMEVRAKIRGGRASKPRWIS